MRFHGLIICLMIMSTITFYINEPVERGSVHEMYVGIANPSEQTSEDVRARAFMMDTGDIVVSNSFDITRNSNGLARLFWDAPSKLPSGQYVTKIVTSHPDGYGRSSRYMIWEVY